MSKLHTTVIRQPQAFRGLDALARIVAAIVDRAMSRKSRTRKIA